MPRLTQVAHEAIRATVRPGDRVIDATAGNGHDTLFLAGCVGPHGHVLAVDRQSSALANTRERLRAAGLLERVTLVIGDHADLLHIARDDWRGQTRALVFNLGYLPGSDKSVITTPGSTRRALDASRELLAPGGLISVLIYRGHAGGHDEETMIQAWLSQNVGAFASIQWLDGDFPTESSPRLLLARK